MNARQNQVMDAFVRVQAFLDAHPATGTLTYGNARETLDEVLVRVRAFAGAQYEGRDGSRIALRRQEDWAAQLVEDFMRPIVTIARAQIGASSEVGLPDGLRLPKLPMGPTKLLARCDAMLAAARRYEAVFVAHGMPADFLVRFAAARNNLHRAVGARATQVVTHVTARTQLRAELVRGRRAVDRLDAIVRSSFRLEPALVNAWRMAKRVQLVPGARAGSGVGVGTAAATVDEASSRAA
ncbi:MAG: hypothetical protein K8S21_13520 [Gemmatimonadetes bacterium]|nr:hypothetical protein [Gemmatimonadota bacterium]